MSALGDHSKDSIFANWDNQYIISCWSKNDPTINIAVCQTVVSALLAMLRVGILVDYVLPNVLSVFSPCVELLYIIMIDFSSRYVKAFVRDFFSQSWRHRKSFWQKWRTTMFWDAVSRGRETWHGCVCVCLWMCVCCNRMIRLEM